MGSEQGGVEQYNGKVCCNNLYKYRQLVGTEGVAVKERLDTAIEGTASSVLTADVFSEKDSEGLPAHPNLPDVVRISPTFDINTTQIGSSHQSIYEAWINLPEAGYLRDNDGTSEKGMVFLSGCCGNLKQEGNEWREVLLPRTRQQTNGPVLVSAGLHRIRVYLHDRSGTNSGFDLEFSKDLTSRSNVTDLYIAKPKWECKMGMTSDCGSVFQDANGVELVFDHKTKHCKPTCDECLGGSSAPVIHPEDTFTIIADSLPTSFPSNPLDNDTVAVTDTGDETGLVTELYKFDEETNTRVDVTVADINTILGPAVVDSTTDPNNVKVTIPYINEFANNPDVVFNIPMPTPVSVVNNIDLKPTANPNEFVVEIVYTNDLGVQTTITDSTPITIPENRDYVEYPGNNVPPTGAPPLGVDTTVLDDGSRYDRDGTKWILVETCPGPMTRGQLLALRNAGNLKVQCHYIITNYNRGNVGAATILLHAVDENTLSMDVHVKTTYDRVARDGRYDIDTGRIVELKDNLGNKVSGRTGVEVDRFDRGNTRHTEVVLDNMDLLVDRGTTFRLTNLNLKSDSNLDIRGATGFIYNADLNSDANLQLRNAVNVGAQDFKMEADAQIAGNGSVNLIIQRSSMDADAYRQITNRTDARMIYSSMGNNSYAYFYNGTRQRLYGVDITSRGTLRQYQGDLRMYYHEISGYGEIRKEAASTGLTYIYGGNTMGRGYVRFYSASPTYVYYPTFSSRGEIRFQQTVTLRAYYIEVGPYDAILTASGTCSYLYGIKLMTGGRFTASGGTHYRVTLHTGCYINTAFNTRYVYGIGRHTTTLSAVNSNRGRDYFNSSLI